MNTPIYSFVRAYASSAPVRLHMPGHKGRGPLGCEALDITEIPGADSLYEAAGVIAESEQNASRLFGCPTFYSAEGSSHCIRAMLLLATQLVGGDGQCLSAVCRSKDLADTRQQTPRDAACEPPRRLAATKAERFRVLAARNAHKTFLSAAALLDLDVCWLPAGDGSYLSAAVTPLALDAALQKTGASAVYLTCPDYLGNLPQLRPLADVCHAHGALLLVDNAHGAYLRFLNPSRHPIDLGADLCCDSAHKTLPVLTGGAYLHLSRRIAPELVRTVRDALALFGSTSPSYLILQSLDLANPCLERLPERLETQIPKIDALKRELSAVGYRLYGQEPLKLTLRPRALGLTGTELAHRLEERGIYCEFADPDFIVFMFSPQTDDASLSRLRAVLLESAATGPISAAAAQSVGTSAPESASAKPAACPERVCSIRQAMLSPCLRVPVAEALGKVLARPGVSCPPAVPILMPGERIDAGALAAFAYYGIQFCEILEEPSRRNTP